MRSMLFGVVAAVTVVALVAANVSSQVAPVLPSNEVPLGAVIPYLGAPLPQGYVWADGKSRWPNAPWVPEHLRNKPVPNMNGLQHYIAGTEDEKIVGNEKGHKELPNHTHGIDIPQLPVEGYTAEISLRTCFETQFFEYASLFDMRPIIAM